MFPDDYEQCHFRSHAMGSARLAIIDLSEEANQPVRSQDGRWDLVFNGELYNFKELAIANGLSAKAHPSDTWALLELIAKVGAPTAHRQFHGMYSIAVWNRVVQRLYLLVSRSESSRWPGRNWKSGRLA